MSGATALKTYRDVAAVSRSATATPHQLVDLLYSELSVALEVMGRALALGNQGLARAQHQRALELILTLEAGLDRVNGGGLAATLAQIYRQMRGRLIAARQGDAEACREVAEGVGSLHEAWRKLV